MGLGWGEFVGVTGDNAPHSHHAIQILISNHPQPVWTASLGWRDLYGAVMGPELRHQLGSSGQPVHLLYVEPHSNAGCKLLALLDTNLCILTSTECEAIHRALKASVTPEAAIVEALMPSSAELKAKEGDADIEAWITKLPMMLPERLSAAECAKQLNLSSSRFLHRFRAHTGLPLRPYLRWRRLLVALGEVMRGATLTDAAHAAGFSDAAHFTRTFQRHFGLAPSTLTEMAASQ